MKTIVLNRIHKNINPVLRQLFNYNRYFNQDTLYLFHKSIESDIDELDLMKKIPNDLKERVIFCSKSYPTQWMCTFGGYLSLYEELITRRISADNVFIHSDGDLLLGGVVSSTFDRFTFGYGCHSFKPDSTWHWAPHVKSDPYLKMVLRSLSMTENDICFGRQEGAFFPYEQYMEIMKIATLYYSEKFLLEIHSFYPIEEVIFPTFFNKICGDKSKKCNNLILSKENNFKGGRGMTSVLNQYITTEDILEMKKVHDADLLWGAKWFSPSLEDSAAIFACDF